MGIEECYKGVSIQITTETLQDPWLLSESNLAQTSSNQELLGAILYKIQEQ